MLWSPCQPPPAGARGSLVQSGKQSQGGPGKSTPGGPVYLAQAASRAFAKENNGKFLNFFQALNNGW